MSYLIAGKKIIIWINKVDPERMATHEFNIIISL